MPSSFRISSSTARAPTSADGRATEVTGTREVLGEFVRADRGDRQVGGDAQAELLEGVDQGLQERLVVDDHARQRGLLAQESFGHRAGRGRGGLAGVDRGGQPAPGRRPP